MSIARDWSKIRWIEEDEYDLHVLLASATTAEVSDLAEKYEAYFCEGEDSGPLKVPLSKLRAEAAKHKDALDWATAEYASHFALAHAATDHYHFSRIPVVPRPFERDSADGHEIPTEFLKEMMGQKFQVGLYVTWMDEKHLVADMYLLDYDKEKDNRPRFGSVIDHALVKRIGYVWLIPEQFIDLNS